MNPGLVERIADAVLYEGYILYPYRPSAVKNQQRWNFGALCPQSYSEAQGGTEAWTMQTECIVEGGEETSLDIKVRFLHLVTREVGRLSSEFETRIAGRSDEEIAASITDSDFEVVPSLEVNEKLFQTWQEAIEREVRFPAFKPSETNKESERTRRMTFSFPNTREIELLRDDNSNQIAGIVVRRQQAIDGAIEVPIEEQPVTDRGCFKITVRILNLTMLQNPEQKSRDDALMRSFVSTHTILAANEGEFVSLLDPPEELKASAAGCLNLGTYPVLAGEEGDRSCVLSSPIILYDYPQIAPESAGNLFDGTEIDEILTLRIMTLTDEEKREMRGADDRARQILERTESLPVEQLMKMHGAMKGCKS
jgi:hydrogenase maturation protease